MTENISEEKIENSDNVKYDNGVWKELFKYMGFMKNQFAVLIVLMILLAGVDLVFPLMIGYAIDNFVALKTTDGLIQFSALYLFLILALSLIVFLFIRQAGKVEQKLLHMMRRDSFNNLQKLSFSYYDNNALGWTIAKVTSDSAKISGTIAWGMVDFVWGITYMTGIAGVMLYLNVKLALVTLAVVPLLFIISLLFQKKLLKLHRNVRKINSKITGLFNDGIVGAKTSKTLAREELNIKEFKGESQNMNVTSVKAATYSAAYLPLVLIFGTVGLVLSLIVGDIYINEEIVTVGTLVVFITYARQFYDPILELARIYTEIISAQAAGERVMALIHERSTITDSQEVIEKYGTIDKPLKENWEEIKGHMEFKNINFHYKEGEPILKDFNLKVNQGDTIALVGETGSGKSTIVNLACRFYEPVSGELLIDGVDYRERSQVWLHSNIGYVLQSPHLFAGTIKDNIRYSKPEASDEEIIESAKIVKAHEFIMKFPDGYDTNIGESGALLSTGQKQLLSFARAILARPKIFFLDEATSSIDTETEMLIQDAIDRVLENRTSFIVAHRLSTIRNATKILVISKGLVIESGDHDELIAQKGHYYELYQNQFIEEAERKILK